MQPRIFISAVTSELTSTRQLAANVLTRLGYTPMWQDIFGTESGAELEEWIKNGLLVESSTKEKQVLEQAITFCREWLTWQ